MNTTKKLLVLAVLALGACRADNRSSITILGRAAPSSATDCTFAAGGEFQLGAGILDLGANYGGFLRYRLPLYVNNLMADPTAANDGAVATSKAWRFDGARVRVNPAAYVSDIGPSPALLPFQAENTLPGDGQVIEVGGKSVLLVDVVSHELGQAIQAAATAGQVQRIVLGVTLRGSTADGALDTAEWYYPVDVCVGCLACTGCTGTTPICAAPAIPLSSCGGPGQDTDTICAAPAP